MKGEGIRADFTVTESDEEVEVSADEQELVETRPWPTTRPTSRTSPTSCVEKTQEFVDLYKAGDDDAARALYPVARTHWERIETVAESFGDLDPMMDAREADLEEGQEWTGWHLIEKDLWPAACRGLHRRSRPTERAIYADDLMDNTDDPRQPRAGADLHRRPDRQRLARPARGGRHRQGHRRGGVLVAHRPVGLPGQRRRRPGGLRRRAADRRAERPRARRGARHPVRRAAGAARRAARPGDGFIVLRRADRRTQVKELSNAVNALSEPLSQLTAAVLS